MGTISLLHPFSCLPLSPSLAWFDMPHAPSQTDGRRAGRAGCNTNNTILSDCGGGSDDSLRSGERREREYPAFGQDLGPLCCSGRQPSSGEYKQILLFSARWLLNVYLERS